MITFSKITDLCVRHFPEFGSDVTVYVAPESLAEIVSDLSAPRVFSECYRMPSPTHVICYDIPRGRSIHIYSEKGRDPHYVEIGGPTIVEALR